MNVILRSMAVALLLTFMGVSVVGADPPVGGPPGQSPCSHGNTGKPCVVDPGPGKDCLPHGRIGGINENHCLPFVPPVLPPTGCVVNCGPFIPPTFVPPLIPPYFPPVIPPVGCVVNCFPLPPVVQPPIYFPPQFNPPMYRPPVYFPPVYVPPPVFIPQAPPIIIQQPVPPPVIQVVQQPVVVKPAPAVVQVPRSAPSFIPPAAGDGGLKALLGD